MKTMDDHRVLLKRYIINRVARLVTTFFQYYLSTEEPVLPGETDSIAEAASRLASSEVTSPAADHTDSGV